MITVAGRILAEIQILQKLIWPEWELQPDSKATMPQGLCCRSSLRLIRGLPAGVLEGLGKEYRVLPVRREEPQALPQGLFCGQGVGEDEYGVRHL